MILGELGSVADSVPPSQVKKHEETVYILAVLDTELSLQSFGESPLAIQGTQVTYNFLRTLTAE